MGAFGKNVVFLLLALLAQQWAQLAQGQSSSVTRSCPLGWLVYDEGRASYQCRRDPCSLNACGPGNTCTTQDLSGRFLLTNCSQCNPPYKSGSSGGSFNGMIDTVCYLPGQDACNPNPCQNGGTCSYRSSGGPPYQTLTDEQGTKYAFACDCPFGTQFGGITCNIKLDEIAPKVIATVNGVSGPLASAVIEGGLCGPGSQIPPIPCLFNDGHHYTCCNGGFCGPIGPDGYTPICPDGGFTPSNNDLGGPTGYQGVCGAGAAAAFPVRCFFNGDTQGQYVCCDAQGCNGFNDDNLTPHCKNYGYVPPNNGLPPTAPPSTPSSTPPSPPPSGDQGVCGSGAATAFPTRCYFNSDPQGRYVCCDNQGCNGFNNDNLTPHCKNYGYVPPNNGLAGPTPPTTPPSTPPSTSPSGKQGVCGTGGATGYPLRCWFNNDAQGRYVCCDNDGCNGFAPPDFLFPRCKTNGYAPPGFGA